MVWGVLFSWCHWLSYPETMFELMTTTAAALCLTGVFSFVECSEKKRLPVT